MWRVSPMWRRVGYALLASALLHAFVLLPGVPLPATMRGAGALQARLAAPPVAALPVGASVPRVPTVPPDVPPMSRSVASTMPSSGRPVEAAVPVVSPVIVPAVRPQHRVADQRLPDDRDALAGVDAEAVRSYRIALAGGARRQRQTLPAADLTGLSGRVGILVSVDAAGVHVSLGSSSGQSVLDAAAMQLMSAAVAEVPLPSPLQGRGFALEVPVMFGTGR